MYRLWSRQERVQRRNQCLSAELISIGSAGKGQKAANCQVQLQYVLLPSKTTESSLITSLGLMLAGFLGMLCYPGKTNLPEFFQGNLKKCGPALFF